MFYPVRRRQRGDYPSLLDRDWFSQDIFGSFEDNFNSMFNDYDLVPYKTDDGKYVYEMDVPGFNKDNLKVELSDGILTVRGESGEDKRKRSVYRKITVGSCDNMDAELKDGVLKVTLEYKKNNVKTIEIK